MRKRFLFCFAFGAVGLASALPIAQRFSLAPYQAVIGCMGAGIFLGYLLSVFLDVFLASPNSNEN